MKIQLECGEIDGEIVIQVASLRRILGETLYENIISEIGHLSEDEVSLSQAQVLSLNSRIKSLDQSTAALFRAGKLVDQITPAANETIRRELVKLVAQANKLVILAGL